MSRLEVRHRFLSVRVINTWNALAPQTVKTYSLTTFKRLLRHDLDEKLFSFFLGVADVNNSNLFLL